MWFTGVTTLRYTGRIWECLNHNISPRTQTVTEWIMIMRVWCIMLLMYVPLLPPYSLWFLNCSLYSLPAPCAPSLLPLPLPALKTRRVTELIMIMRVWCSLCHSLLSEHTDSHGVEYDYASVMHYAAHVCANYSLRAPSLFHLLCFPMLPVFKKTTWNSWTVKICVGQIKVNQTV